MTTENLIHRATIILACQSTQSEAEAAEILMGAGVSAEDAFLAVMAAKIFAAN